MGSVHHILYMGMRTSSGATGMLELHRHHRIRDEPVQKYISFDSKSVQTKVSRIEMDLLWDIL